MSSITNKKRLKMISLLETAFKSKNKFKTQYLSYGEDDTKQFHLLIIMEIHNSILNGTTDQFQNLAKLFLYIKGLKDESNLQDFHNNSDNPFMNTNIVIECCKFNKEDMLLFIFSNHDFLSMLARNIQPTDQDNECHNAFYYAIRSCNVSLLHTLIVKWPKDFFLKNAQQLDEILSRAYKELKLKHINLSEDMELFVEDKLIGLRFFCNEFENKNMDQFSLNDILDRVEILLENINLFKVDLCNSEEVKEKALLIATFIAHNVHVLKRKLRSTYDRIPWEEIEFCLIIFVTSYKSHQDVNLFYHHILTSYRIMHHVENFCLSLQEIIPLIKKSNVDDLKKEPALKDRSKVIEYVTKNNPKYQKLYQDYEKLMDIYALTTISKHISLAISVDPCEKQEQIVIIRALQVTGEYMKNTLESPKLSIRTSKLLLECLPPNTKQIITKLRNSLSHFKSLCKRHEIETNMNATFYKNIQTDIQKIGSLVENILCECKVETVKQYLATIMDTHGIPEIKNLLRLLHYTSKEIKPNIRCNKLEKIKSLIADLRGAIENKTSYEDELFNRMNEELQNGSFGSENDAYETVITAITTFKYLSNSLAIDENIVRGIKYSISKMLNLLKKSKAINMEHISSIFLQILKSASQRIEVVKFGPVVSKLFEMLEFNLDNVRWIEELRDRLYKNEPNLITQCVLTPSQFLKEKTCFVASLLEKQTKAKNNHESWANMQVALESLMLDITSVLNETEKRFTNNSAFLDDSFPLLIGKSLRNHLAHGNIIIDLSLSNVAHSIKSNAKKLLTEQALSNNIYIGKITKYDSLQLRRIQEAELNIITKQEKLFEALANGDVENAKYYISLGGDIHARSMTNLQTAAHFSARSNNIEALQFILNQNIDITAKDIHGQNPLHVAAQYGRENMVQFILQKNAKLVNILNNELRTPLHFAASNGNDKTVAILLQYNAKIQMADIEGKAPVHHAIHNNHISVAKMLLKKHQGVDENLVIGDFTCLHIAADMGLIGLVEFLLDKKANTNARTKIGATPLQLASLNGHLEIVQALISKGANVNSASIAGGTALHNASETGRDEIVKVLLENGANVNAKYYEGKHTPLNYAAFYGFENIAKMLIHKNADVNAVTVSGQSLLHTAASRGNLKIVLLLLNNKAVIDIQDINGCTALFLSTQNGHENVVKTLLHHGANVEYKNRAGNTALHVAVTCGHKEIVEMLLNEHANVHSINSNGVAALHLCCCNGQAVNIKVPINDERENIQVEKKDGSNYRIIMEMLVTHGASTKVKDFKGFSALHYCALFGNSKQVIQYLIEKGADVNVKSKNMLTPLHLAIEGGHIEVAEIFIDNGSSIGAKDIYGKTPLIYAAKSNNIKLLQLLIKKGADIRSDAEQILQNSVIYGFVDFVKNILSNFKENISDTIMCQCLMKAASKDNKNIVEELLINGATADFLTEFEGTESSALFIAVEKSNVPVLKVLLKKMVNVNMALTDGTTLLHIASTKDNSEMVNILLQHGANANLKDHKDRLPIELAVAHNRLDTVKLLLAHSKFEKSHAFPLLNIAAENGCLEITDYLIENKHDIYVKNILGSKPIHIAAREGHTNLVKFFLDRGISIEETGANLWSLLHYAAAGGQTNVARLLIDSNLNINALSQSGSTPLHEASRGNFKDVIDILLKNGAKYNTVNKLSLKPAELTNDPEIRKLFALIDDLFEAVKNNNPANVRDCILKGALIDIKNSSDVTPLHYASWKNFGVVIDILLEYNANPNIIGKSGCTPLHYASKFNHFKVVKALLSNGAIFDIECESNKTPLDFASIEDIKHLLAFIQKAFMNVKTGKVNIMADFHNIKNIELLRAIFNARSKENKTLITTAIHNNFPKLKQLQEILQDDSSFLIHKAKTMLMQEQYKDAYSIFKTIFEKRKILFGADDSRTLDVQNDMAKALYKQQKYNESLLILKEVSDKRETVLGINNEDTLETKGFIALILHRLGQNEESLIIFNQIQDIQEKVLGENHPHTLRNLLHKALVLNELHKFDDALQANCKVLDKYKKRKGLDNPETLCVQNNIAMVLNNLQKYDEALNLYEEVHKRRKRVLGPNHSDTLRTMHNIAVLRAHHFNNDESPGAEIFSQVLDAQTKTLGKSHIDTLNTQNNMAYHALSQGNYREAMKIFKSTQEQRKSLLGADHPTVSQTEKIIQGFDSAFKMAGVTGFTYSDISQIDVNQSIVNGDVDVQNLSENNYDFNSKDAEGRSALHFAVSSDHENIIKALLKVGVNCFTCTNKGNTPLHTAVSKNNKQIAKMLLEHMKNRSADKLTSFIDAKSISGGKTALHVAAKAGYAEIVEMLLKYGAIYDIIDCDGKSPFQVSTSEEVLALLRLTKELFDYANTGNVLLIDRLRKLSDNELLAVANARKIDGNTISQVLLKQKHKSLARKFLKILHVASD